MPLQTSTLPRSVTVLFWLSSTDRSDLYQIRFAVFVCWALGSEHGGSVAASRAATNTEIDKSHRSPNIDRPVSSSQLRRTSDGLRIALASTQQMHGASPGATPSALFNNLIEKPSENPTQQKGNLH